MKGKTVVYIGDGSGDYDGAAESDYVFAVRDSRLSERCKRNRVPFVSFLDFDEVIKSLKKIRF
jgi:2-hydroxy-3-keto-5-methylthiopentenyl-1-phosphate phosphatase